MQACLSASHGASFKFKFMSRWPYDKIIKMPIIERPGPSVASGTGLAMNAIMNDPSVHLSGAATSSFNGMHLIVCGEYRGMRRSQGEVTVTVPRT